MLKKLLDSTSVSSQIIHELVRYHTPLERINDIGIKDMELSMRLGHVNFGKRENKLTGGSHTSFQKRSENMLLT